MKHAEILGAVRHRLQAARLSTRPWVLLGFQCLILVFDDTDTLVSGTHPWAWQAVALLIKAELGRCGIAVGETEHDGEMGLVHMAYRRG